MNVVTAKPTNNIVVKIILGKTDDISKEESDSFIRMANDIKKTSSRINSLAGKALILLGIGLFVASFFIPFSWPVIVIILIPFSVAWIVSKVFERQAKEATTYFQEYFPNAYPKQPKNQSSSFKIDLHDPKYSVAFIYKD